MVPGSLFSGEPLVTLPTLERGRAIVVHPQNMVFNRLALTDEGAVCAAVAWRQRPQLSLDLMF